VEITLIRKFLLHDYTIGNISIDGIWLCNSMEPTVRKLIDLNGDGDFLDEGEGKIMGKTAIPEGRYKVEFRMFTKYGRLMLMLLDVPGFSGIFIHSGKVPEHTAGCILPGENKAKGEVWYSPYYVNILENKAREAFARKEEVWIEIRDHEKL
jgi:Family of unknown function (DUF5675)